MEEESLNLLDKLVRNETELYMKEYAPVGLIWEELLTWCLRYDHERCWLVTFSFHTVQYSDGFPYIASIQSHRWFRITLF